MTGRNGHNHDMMRTDAWIQDYYVFKPNWRKSIHRESLRICSFFKRQMHKWYWLLVAFSYKTSLQQLCLFPSTVVKDRCVGLFEWNHISNSLLLCKKSRENYFSQYHLRYWLTVRFSIVNVICIQYSICVENLNVYCGKTSMRKNYIYYFFSGWLAYRKSVWPEWCHVDQLEWRHNERHIVSNHIHLDCLPNVFFVFIFRRKSKNTSKLRVTGLCEGNPLVSGGFPLQRGSNAEQVSIWWRHHAILINELKNKGLVQRCGISSMPNASSVQQSVSSHVKIENYCLEIVFATPATVTIHSKYYMSVRNLFTSPRIGWMWGMSSWWPHQNFVLDPTPEYENTVIQIWLLCWKQNLKRRVLYQRV